MKFYSTNRKSDLVGLKDAVIKGLAPDGGLYLPETIPVLSESFFERLGELSFKEMSRTVATSLLGQDLPQDVLTSIVDRTVSFDAPLVKVEDDTYALELFHGPTLAFKDFGARFMSELLGYYAKQQSREITVLVATSGDTGSAVANGFLDVKGTRVVILYPSGKVSNLQEKQFTTQGSNIVALEIDGTFDDCQRLVKEAFLDSDLNERLFLTSANSINIARLLPQAFYYFYAYSRLTGYKKPVVFSVPSGNFGNLTAGVIATKMGLPVYKFIAATNVNDMVPRYLETNQFVPRPSKMTVSNAMDVGNPSNFARLDTLFNHDVEQFRNSMEGFAFTDRETMDVMREVYDNNRYIMDPHGAVAYLGLSAFRRKHRGDFTGVFLETAHPAKFESVVTKAIQESFELPPTLSVLMDKPKRSLTMSSEFDDLKKFLLQMA